MTLDDALRTLAEADPQQLHETLVFIGATDPDRMARAEAALHLLTCRDDQIDFWFAILAGHRGTEAT